MPKLVFHDDDIVAYEVRRRWKRRGHEVALVRLTNKEAPDYAESCLVCECSLDVEERVVDGKVVGRTSKSDPYKCEAKKAVRRDVMRKAHRKNAARWRRMGLKRAILDIHRRVKDDEFLGQWLSGCVYTQEVAQLLGRDDEEVLAACRELYAEERLDLTGRILTDYAPGFRFPTEMAGIMRWLVEEPLGGPLGDAGDCWLGPFEAEVQRKHGFKSGKDAFGRHWPNIDGVILASCGLEPVAAALRSFVATRPDFQGSDEEIGRHVEECVQDCLIANPLDSIRRLTDIKPAAFEEFVRALLRLSFERIEIDRQMRTVKVPPVQTLLEMADYFEKVAENFHAQAK